MPIALSAQPAIEWMRRGIRTRVGLLQRVPPTRKSPAQDLGRLDTAWSAGDSPSCRPHEVSGQSTELAASRISFVVSSRMGDHRHVGCLHLFDRGVRAVCHEHLRCGRDRVILRSRRDTRTGSSSRPACRRAKRRPPVRTAAARPTSGRPDACGRSLAKAGLESVPRDVQVGALGAVGRAGTCARSASSGRHAAGVPGHELASDSPLVGREGGDVDERLDVRRRRRRRC